MSPSSSAGFGTVAVLATVIAAVLLLSGHGPRRSTRSVPLVVAHRGGALLAPENTVVAFEHAVAAGVDMVELDVHLSKDGHVVVIHDPELKRLTGQEGEVSDYMYAELQAFRVSIRKGKPAEYGPQHIPLLSEVLDLLPEDMGLQLEIKVRADGSRYEGIEEKVLYELERRDMLDRTLVISFDFPTLLYLKEIEPAVKTGALVSKAYMTAVGPGGPARVVSDMLELDVDYLCINYNYLSRTLADKVHKAGLSIGTWTVNDEDAMRRMADMKVEAITTDDWERSGQHEYGKAARRGTEAKQAFR